MAIPFKTHINKYAPGMSEVHLRHLGLLETSTALIVIEGYPLCVFDVWLPFGLEHERIRLSFYQLGILETSGPLPTDLEPAKQLALEKAQKWQRTLPKDRLPPSERLKKSKRMLDLFHNWS